MIRAWRFGLAHSGTCYVRICHTESDANVVAKKTKRLNKAPPNQRLYLTSTDYYCTRNHGSYSNGSFEMNPAAIILALISLLSTLLGGFIVLKFKKSLSIIFAFAAGSIVTVALMEILPESLAIANKSGIPVKYIMMSVVLSFLFFIILEKYFSAHPIKGIMSEGHVMGPIGAGSLILLSLLDGLTMGIAFQVRISIGIVVAISIIIHDLPDGINTVVLMLKNEESERKAVLYLLMDGLAPLLGVLLTSVIIFPTNALAILLAVFAGQFIYVGAASLLPESQEQSIPRIAVATTLGFLFIFMVTIFL
jgi:ZIP family zinc transporter